MRFFFYGTLIAGSANPVAAAVHRHLRPLGPAMLRGRLYAVPDRLGWYPALRPGAGLVHGHLYEAGEGFGRAALARLDGWEDCDPARPAASLYRRVRVIAASPGAGDRALAAQAYRFNRALPAGARRIAGGDFPAWLAATGRTAYPGAGRRPGTNRFRLAFRRIPH